MSNIPYKVYANVFLDYNIDMKNIPKNKKLQNTIFDEKKKRLILLLKNKMNESSNNHKKILKKFNITENKAIEYSKFYKILIKLPLKSIENVYNSVSE